MKIRPRGKGKWQLVWELGRDETGRRIQRYETFYGTKREAEEEWSRKAPLYRQMRRARNPRDLTVAELADEWIADLQQRGRAPSTIRQYATHLRLYVLPRIGGAKVRAITDRDLRLLLASLPGHLAPRTVAICRHVLRALFRQAVVWGYLAVSPADSLARPTQRQFVPHLWSDAEIRRFWDACAGERLGALFEVLLLTGLRIGEALALEWGDIDLERGCISVRRQLDTRTRELRVPKSRRGIRLVSIGPEAVAVLSAWRRRQLEEHVRLGLGSPRIVFDSLTGTHLLYRNVFRTFRRLCAAAHIRPVRIHDLRHLHATALLVAGVHPQVVSERLGHASVAFTLETYSHVLPPLHHEAARQGEAALLGGRMGGKSHKKEGPAKGKAP